MTFTASPSRQEHLSNLKLCSLGLCRLQGCFPVFTCFPITLKHWMKTCYNWVPYLNRSCPISSYFSVLYLETLLLGGNLRCVSPTLSSSIIKTVKCFFPSSTLWDHCIPLSLSHCLGRLFPWLCDLPCCYAYALTVILRKNISGKIKNPSKVRPDRKTLISVFPYLLSTRKAGH